MASISWSTDDGRTESVEFDVLVSYSVAHAAKATQFPVETGTTISDHVLQEADGVRLEGLVTNTPLPSNVRLGLGAFVAAASAKTFTGRARSAHAALLGAKEAGRAVTIDTPLSWYEDMVIESLEVGETADAADGLSFSISARKIRTTSTKTVAAPVIEKAKAKVSKGRQPTKESSAKPDSVTKSIFNPSAP